MKETWEFLSKVHKRGPLSSQEECWLRIFEDTAGRFRRDVDHAESFEVSFDALQRCHTVRMSGNEAYLRRACKNAHLTLVRDRRRRRFRDRVYDLPDLRREAVDTRLDLEEALGKMPPRLARLLIWRKEACTVEEIAGKLGLGLRQTSRLMREAEGWIVRLLGRSYAGERCPTLARPAMPA